MRLSSEFWSDPSKFDVAILQLEIVPAGVHPLRMERAATCRLDAKLYTFGYASAADEIGISGYGEFRNFPTGIKVSNMERDFYAALAARLAYLQVL